MTSLNVVQLTPLVPSRVLASDLGHTPYTRFVVRGWMSFSHRTLSARYERRPLLTCGWFPCRHSQPALLSFRLAKRYLGSALVVTAIYTS